MDLNSNNIKTMAMSSYVSGIPITPSDSNNTPSILSGLFVGTGGDVSVQFNGQGSPHIFKNVPNSTILPFKIDKVMATNTTAGDFVGLI